MILGEPNVHEWLVPKLNLGTHIFSKLRFAGQVQLGPQTRSQAQLGNEEKSVRKSLIDAIWQPAFQIYSIDEDWETVSAKPGVYIIRTNKAIERIAARDGKGIIYIGKSLRVRERLWQFWYSNHPASGLLWDNLPLARLVLGKEVKNKIDYDKKIGALTVKIASPINRDDLDKAERAVLFAYLFNFGELPPLNFSLGRRWDDKPHINELKWGRKGIFGKD